ncbi:MAG: hypothetical protein NVSMB38_33100 [Ktedonobacteraceae bacterium]
MFIIEFLKQAVPPDDQVTLSFIDVMVPKMLERYVVMSAKGGMHHGDERLSEDTQRKFEANDDQSMFSHLLNGIFPTLRLMHLLESERAERFTDTERKVYILSYLMHDVDKITRRIVETDTREAIEHSKACIADELSQCDAAEFFPDVAAYIEDITFLVVNTQRKWGTHFNTYLWNLHLPERRVLLLRSLCTYSDLIAYKLKAPGDITQATDLADILNTVSRGTLTFSYHHVREVRGLFTSVVNNGVGDLFTDRKKREGIWPYLFFSDGVVYILRKTLKFSITTEQIVASIRAQLQRVCGELIKHNTPGFKFSIQGIAKHPDYYFEFLTLEDYMDLLCKAIINRTRNDITTTPLEKLRQMQANGEIDAPLPDDAQPDLRTSMLSRFFSVVFATVLGMLDKTQDALHAQVEREVVQTLGLTPYWDKAKTIPNKGGVEYRWFWLGAWYLHDHKGIATHDGTDSLQAVFRNTFALLMTRIGDELRVVLRSRQKYLNHLTEYLEAAIDLPMNIRAGTTLPDFYTELEGYASAKGKSKGRKLICTLCNSAYPTEPQSDNAVLFQPWVYKNKISLYAGTNAGGVCAICALELMLRQLLQKGALRLTGSKFEAMKTKYVSVYPNYFFTPETGTMVQGIVNELSNLNFFTLRRQLTGHKLSVYDVLTSDMFEPVSASAPSRVAPNDDEDDSSDEDISDTPNEPTKERTDRGYIKYEYPAESYPGMCFFGMRAGKDDNDTASWAMPALLALALPLVTGAKVVISELLLPLFSSGHDFQETVVFDAPHPYLSRLLDESEDPQHKNRVRVNRVLNKLELLTQVYQVNIETYAKGGKPEWKHLLGIVRDLETDPLHIFSYLRKQDRIKPLYSNSIDEYVDLYRRVCKELLGKAICETRFDMKEDTLDTIQQDSERKDNLGHIQKCVDRYVRFYHGKGDESHSILRPISIVARAIINSPVDIKKDDSLWQIRGEMKSWMDRVRNRYTSGRAIFWKREDVHTKEADAIEEFVTYFYEQVYVDYCQEQRGLLRSRLNQFKDGCEAYYLQWRRKNLSQRQVEDDVEEQEQEIVPM